MACYDFIAKVDIIIPEFGSCSDDTCSVTIVDQLINVIDACTTALGTLPDGSRSGNGTLADSAADTVAVSLGELLGSDVVYSQAFSENRE